MSRITQDDDRASEQTVIAVGLAVAFLLPMVHAVACQFAMRLYPTLILFYCGLTLLFLVTVGMAAMAVGIVASRCPRQRFLASLTVGCVAVASAALTLAFFVVVPVTLDRSISTFLLSRFDACGHTDAMTEADLHQAFDVDYVKKNGAIRRRLAEQLASGTIRRNDAGDYELTGRGWAFLRLARKITWLYGVTPDYVTATVRKAELPDVPETQKPGGAGSQSE